MLIRKITCLIVFIHLICIGLGAISIAETPESEITLHVSVNGKKTADGSDLNPFDSIETAKKALRSINSDGANVTILIHGGEYNVTSKISFDNQDSAQDGHLITYKAAGDGDVILRGSREIDIGKFKPITDPKVIAQLYPGLSTKIGCIDLTEFGFDTNSLDFLSNVPIYVFPSVLGVYLNGQRQQLAKYPNQGWERIVSIVEETAVYPDYPNEDKGGIVEIAPISNMYKWVDAPYACLMGYMGAEYAKQWRQIKEVNVNERTVSFKKYTPTPPYKNGKYVILNLLEELDMPGEFYIDKDQCILYYYPSHNLNPNEDKMTIVAFHDRFIEINNAKNIMFEGISFAENMNDGVVITDSTNITLKNCTFSNVGGTAVEITGQSKNCLVSGCKFMFTSKAAVILAGGDSSKLIHGENEVSNCYFYNTGIDGGGNSDGGAIVNGCGNIFRNNTMHNIENYPISYSGCENQMTHNEIFNNIRNTADAAVIYTGRTFLNQGNVISHNFLYENVMYNMTSGLGSHAIAYDDWSSGGTVSHNIIYMGRKTGTTTAAANGSRDTVLRYNTSICSTTGLAAGFRDVAGVTNNKGSWSSILEQLFRNSQMFDSENALWRSKYSSFSQIMADIQRDNDMILPRNHIITDNVSVDVVRDDIPDKTRELSIVERNVIFDDYSVFVDPDNRDYRLKSSVVKEYNLSGELLSEDNWDMDRMGVSDQVLVLEKPQGKFYKTYPRNGETDLQRGDVLIAWEKPLYSDEFYYKVATDPQMENIVAQGRTMDTCVRLENLQNGGVYYWTVTAKNISRRFKNEWEAQGEPYLFTVAAYDDLDKKILKQNIDTAKLTFAQIQVAESPEVGKYKSEVLDEFNKLITSAEMEYAKTYNSQISINEMARRLSEFVDGLGGYCYAGYANISTKNKDDWEHDANTEMSFKGETITAKPLNEGGSAHINTTGKLSKFEILNFNLKMNNIAGFSMISIRNSAPKDVPYSAEGYTICLKPDVIELQKGSKVVATRENHVEDGPIKEGVWHHYEFGAIDNPGGVGVTVAIDGNMIFEYLDSDQPFYHDGGFVVHGYRDMTFELEPAKQIKEGFYETPQQLYQRDASEMVYGNTHGIYGETGVFKDGNNGIRISDGNKAAAKWEGLLKAGYFEVSYTHNPIPDGATNAKISIQSGGGITGKTVFKLPVDFSRGKAGEKKLGTILIMGLDGQHGDFSFSIETESGVLPVSEIKLVPSNETAFEATKMFYGKNSNVLLMKIDSKTAFLHAGQIDLSTAPVVENSTTLIPLRSVADAFNFDVRWEGTAQKAIIENDHTIVEFVVGSDKLTIDGQEKQMETAAVISEGSVMVALEDLCQAMGKQLHWDNANQLIFIGDVVDISASETESVAMCNRLFEQEFPGKE